MSDSHADGCLAAVLDDTSLITYVWNNKGKYHLYNTYEMKEIRYYRMREWINISENFATIHFNAIYPGKSCLSDGFNKKYRDMVETFVTKAMFPDKENIWTKTTDAYAERDYCYGYGEFSECYMWTLKGEKSQHIHAYNQDIPCPCGCGANLILVAGDKNLREQHFRINKADSFQVKCYSRVKPLYLNVLLHHLLNT